MIGKLFETEFENILTCQEAPEEVPTSSMEKVLRLSCHIDNGNKPIDILNEGLKISLTGQIEKHSQTLGRNALYLKESKINSLVSFVTLYLNLTHTFSARISYVAIPNSLLFSHRTCVCNLYVSTGSRVQKPKTLKAVRPKSSDQWLSTAI